MGAPIEVRGIKREKEVGLEWKYVVWAIRRVV
jgi:hypothetical protein